MNSYADLNTLKSSSYLGLDKTDDDMYLKGLLEAASRSIDSHTKRFFYCDEATKYYDGSSSPMWLDDVLAISTLKTDDNEDGTYENSYTEDTDYFLYPLNDIVKTHAYIRSAGSYGSFASGIKKGVQIAGVFGYGNGESATPYYDSGDDLTAEISSTTAVSATVSDGSHFSVAQTIRIDSEQLYIENIGGGTLTIKRGVNGTTAATHDNASDVYIYEYPQTIKQACLIQAMRWWSRKDSAFADVIGVPELGTVIAKKGLDPDIKILIQPYVRYV